MLCSWMEDESKGSGLRSSWMLPNPDHFRALIPICRVIILKFCFAKPYFLRRRMTTLPARDRCTKEPPVLELQGVQPQPQPCNMLSLDESPPDLQQGAHMESSTWPALDTEIRIPGSDDTS
jgi:hypothetical protein